MPRHKGETVMENTIDVTMLKQQISTAASQPRQDARTAYVEFANVGLGYAVASSYNSPEYEATKATLDNLEKALAGCDDEKRIELATNLLDLWFHGTDDQVRDVFGDCIKVRADRRGMLTLTGSGKQLRVWYSFPGSIEYDHIDSCGVGLLFGIYGHPEIIKRYLASFLGVTHLSSATGKAGARIFVGF